MAVLNALSLQMLQNSISNSISPTVLPAIFAEHLQILTVLDVAKCVVPMSISLNGINIMKVTRAVQAGKEAPCTFKMLYNG